jgi:N12 class adenine-specific DNA methylase
MSGMSGIELLEKIKKNLEDQLAKKSAMKKDKGNIDFEQLGVDALLVDEAQAYKNLFYTTNMQNIVGLGSRAGNQTTFDMFMKIRHLSQLTGGRGIVFATGTPIMNSIVELYSMQKYLQYDLLKEKGLLSFDAWANQFGEVAPILAMNPTGKGYSMKMALARYTNLRVLQKMFRDFADVVLEFPGQDKPAMIGGKPQIIVAKPSPRQLAYIDELQARADAIKGQRAQKGADNPLVIYNDGRKAAYSQI